MATQLVNEQLSLAASDQNVATTAASDQVNHAVRDQNVANAKIAAIEILFVVSDQVSLAVNVQNVAREASDQIAVDSEGSK